MDSLPSIPVPGRVKDITGKKFGRLTAIRFKRSGKQGARWDFKCECGKEIEIRSVSVLSGTTQSCGCLNRDKTTKHGFYGTRTYSSWMAMKSRCLNSKHFAFPRYGGRGISICERWLNSFANFLSDMGERPEDTTIDRINGDGHYEPGNCRWATAKEQSGNLSSNRPIEYLGEIKLIGEWALQAGIKKSTLNERLKRGWPMERAMNRAVSKKKYFLSVANKTLATP